MEYVLVLWPEVQALMDLPWFDAECHLLNPLEDQEQYNSAYFVPKLRLEELKGEAEFMQQLADVIHRSKLDT